MNIQRLAVCSDLRRNVLMSLYADKKSLGHLRDELEISSTTAIHALKELEKYNLTFQDNDKNYLLTNIGRMIAVKLRDFSDAAEVLEKHTEFWLEHDLSGIPELLIEKIGMLKDSELIKDTEIDIFKVHSNFINLLKNAKEIRGVSSIFVPEYTSLFQELVRKNVDVQLILSKEVLDKIDESILNQLITKSEPKFNLFVMNKNLKAAITVTDYFLSIGLFRMDGTYDYSNDLISYSKEAILWGNEFFNYHVKLSE
ncbi:MAG TPA: winged helix-turn-helix domain-containing protein [Candidatus Nanoarchaeia archaeon]|nr:winged helix-turn-helix domain-containing protein [Candidatus Nanoarchaeia archaeon]